MDMMNKILFSQDLRVTLANVPKLSKKHLWHLLQTAATGNSFFWLVDSKKSFSLKPLGQMN